VSGWLEVARRELSHPALFDEGIEAARNACVAGASNASAAITAAAYYDNPLTGAPALVACMQRLRDATLNPAVWQHALEPRVHPETLDPGFTPGFGFVTPSQAEAVSSSLARLVSLGAVRGAGGRSSFWLEQGARLSGVTGPLNATGLMALLFLDHELDADTAERQFLLWKIEIALTEAARARRLGVKAFPFLTEQVRYAGYRPPLRAFDTPSLLARLGLDGADD